MVPRLRDRSRGPELSAVSARILADPLSRTPEVVTVVARGLAAKLRDTCRGQPEHVGGRGGRVRSGRLHLRAGDRLDQAERRNQPTLGEDVECTSFVIIDGELRRWAEQHGHDAVVARQAPHHAGVAVDSCRHVEKADIDHRQWLSVGRGILGHGGVGAQGQLDRIGATTPAAGDGPDRLLLHLGLLDAVLAGQVDVPVLRRTTCPGDVVAGQVAAAGAAPAARRVRELGVRRDHTATLCASRHANVGAQT